VTDLPRRAITRGARLAALPLGYAGRTALGVGKRVGGASAEAVALEVQQRTAEQVFKTLGELKGGAMKFGQAMSIAEVALPEELLGPYRATLTKLQDSAPAMPADTVHRQLVEAFGDDWRDRFELFDDKPTAAASIGQVHKAVWRDGREVAVKIQYPGAGKALMSDLNQVARMARMFASMSPGMDIKPLIAELKDRAAEELDYLHESQNQRQFAAAYEDDEDFVVPHVLAAAPTVVVSEWLDGYSLAKVISDGTQEERDHYGTLYLRFLMSGPTRAKMLHADPHPGNYRVLGDGRLGVLDFGAVAKMPDGPPEAMGSLLRLAMLGDSEATVAGLRAEGFLKPDITVDTEQFLNALLPFAEPAEHEEFHFSRDWMRGHFNRLNDPRNPDFSIGFKINLPPTYMLMHRTWLGGIGVLSQMGATVPMRGELERWLPSFAS
jgi:predicted unusual protein kinase regulating ubiquinone biosynthesis (AarF/ABC1/UbiB family)